MSHSCPVINFIVNPRMSEKDKAKICTTCPFPKCWEEEPIGRKQELSIELQTLPQLRLPVRW